MLHYACESNGSLTNFVLFTLPSNGCMLHTFHNNFLFQCCILLISHIYSAADKKVVTAEIMEKLMEMYNSN